MYKEYADSFKKTGLPFVSTAIAMEVDAWNEWMGLSEKEFETACWFCEWLYLDNNANLSAETICEIVCLNIKKGLITPEMIKKDADAARDIAFDVEDKEA